MASGITRIIVKNLPKHIQDRRFRELFEQKGEVTDVRLIRTAQGVFRRFGYVGYKTEEQAKIAVKFFNNTYIDMSKIQVELSKPIGDNSLSRPWSKHSLGSSAHERLTPNQTLKSSQEEIIASDTTSTVTSNGENRGENEAKQNFIDQLYSVEQTNEKLKEYLQVMAPRSQTRTWANDDINGTTITNNVSVTLVNNSTRVRSNKSGQQDDEEYQDLPVISKLSTSQSEHTTDDLNYTPTTDIDVLESDAEYLKSKVADLDALESQMLMRTKIDSEPIVESLQDDETSTANGLQDILDVVQQNDTDVKQEEHMDTDEQNPSDIQAISETGRLYVLNLPYSTTEESLLQLFEQKGPVAEIHMPVDRESKRPKGFAFVKYLMPEHAINAYTEFDNRFIEGRIVRILPAKDKDANKKQEPLENNKSSFKKMQEQKKKGQGGLEFNWNSLYMSSNAVADSVAARLNIAKSDLLNKESSDMAVRVALAETHVINETKQYLEKHGVGLSTFGCKDRSNAVVLLKNITYGTTVEELDTLCKPFGELGRILLPPAGTIAVVEFLHANDAKNAFRHLAYKRFKSLPLYLEWAPRNCFTHAFDPAIDKPVQTDRTIPNIATEISSKVDGVTATTALSGATLADSAQSEEFTNDHDVISIFVKNLNWITTEATLLKIFSVINGVRSAVIKTKINPKNAKERLSMGFGFVEFATKDAAMNAIKTLQGVIVDGHALELKLSDRQSAAVNNKRRDQDAKDASTTKSTSTKLVIRNVPFEATTKELRQLFGAYSQIKSLRIPKKFAGGHRGFAFVDFVTKKDAENAHKMLQDTHLYGRHLVLEWAEDDTSVEQLREKTAKGFTTSETKRRKVEMDPNEEEEQ